MSPAHGGVMCHAAPMEQWDGAAYASHSQHHRQVDDWFIDRHPPRPADVVVDAGCGTGEFTARLATLVPHGRVVGVEPDRSMLATARGRAAENLEFRHGALQDLERVCAPASADLVVSRAVFHWIALADYPRCYRSVLSVLEPGGWFHAESAGAGNVARVVEVLDELAAHHGLPPATVTFPHAGCAFELLEDAGFHIPAGGVTTVAQRRALDREGLLGFVRTQASLAYVAEADPDRRAAFLADAEQRVDELRRSDGSYDQTFVRLAVLCQRPG